jgi:predicted nucleic acid-binding protein
VDYPGRALFELDRGEKQTIILARKNNADRVIIDERIGRRVAEYLGLDVTGTLGILVKAKRTGLISSFRNLAMDMRQQGIHYNVALIERLAEHLGEKGS